MSVEMIWKSLWGEIIPYLGYNLDYFDTSASSYTTLLLLLGFLLTYGVAELLFAMLVYGYWLPTLNALQDPPLIRNYEDHSLRHKLFERMLLRQEQICQALGVPVKPYLTQCLRRWFLVVGEEESSTDEPTLTCIQNDGLPSKADCDRLFSWQFFNVDSDQMTEEWQQRELAKMYAMLKYRHGIEPLCPTKKSKQKVQPAQMSLEPLCVKYRPLIYYIVFNLCKLFFCSILLWHGFSYHITSTGLPYWFRPAKKQQPIQNDEADDDDSSSSSNSCSDAALPYLFFHGVAPAGPAFYVPMILWGICTDDKSTEIDRPIFLFENPAVSFALTSHAPTEEETAQGVWEAVDRHCSPTTEVSITGHSFGTAIQTYLLHSSQNHRVRQLVMIDPVSLLLSDPDLLTNFVYCRNTNGLNASVQHNSSAWYVMNELFIEHFVRRQIGWYNTELWLEDVPDHCRVLVCLSDGDEIVDPQKIRAYIDVINGDTPILPDSMKHHVQDPSSSKTISTSNTTKQATIALSKTSSTVSTSSSTVSLESASRKKVDLIYWDGSEIGHGSCLFNTKAWQQVRQMMRKQEKQIFKEKAL
jgi:hypothetical protein